MEGNYSQGKIYKLFVRGIEEMCYIGSTTRDLSYRLSVHRCQSNPGQNKTAACVLFEDGNEVDIELVEAYPCASKLELETRERYWIEQFPENINKNIPTRGWKERWIAKRDHNLELHKKWLADNKEHTAAYLAANKDKIREQERARNAAGYSAVRNAKKKEKVKCDICQKEMNKNSLWTHKNTVHATPVAKNSSV